MHELKLHVLCAAVGGTQQPPLRNPPTWRRLDAAGEITNTTGTTTNREKQSTHKFNEVRQRAYILGAREREILLIQQSIQLIQEGYLRELSGILFGILRDTIHEGSSHSFITTESLDLWKPRLDSIPFRKGIRILKGKSNAPVGRPAGRPTHATVDRAGRPGPTESSLAFSRSIGRWTASFLCTFGHAGRPGGRPASSTDRPGGRPGAQSGLLNAPFLVP